MTRSRRAEDVAANVAVWGLLGMIVVGWCLWGRSAGPRGVTAYVSRVIDGDTVVVRLAGERDETVRLRCIDTPELGQPGHDEAKAALVALVGAKTVLLDREPAPGPIDAYGRTLGYLWSKGALVNAEMVRQGHSRYVTTWGPGRYRYLFRHAEKGVRHDR